jgi:D-glucosaminate-6-phosphate ammonia-lyase
VSSKKNAGLDRRELFSAGSAAMLLGAGGATASAAPAENVYTQLGVRPFINATATLTINGGSRMLPEVIAAIEQASHYHVNLDELADAAGARLAQLLQVEWGLVTSGAAAALSHATAACIAGGDPEKAQLLPDLRGLKNEVIMPVESRNVYDHAMRALGVTVIEVSSREELEAAIGPKTAMIQILGVHFGSAKFGLPEVAPVARKAGIPILVDAAADYLIAPNPYIAQGADLVAYSGGKILRGPSTAGLLIGRKDLVQAAWMHSAPHHAFGRAMKVSKEEVVGMVVAVESFLKKRNLQSEFAEWERWYAHITSKVTAVPGVQARVRPPQRGGPFPTLEVSWDPAAIGLTAGEIGKQLSAGEPRIATHAAGEGNSFVIRPVALGPEDHKVIAERLAEVLRGAPKGGRKKAPPAPAKADLSGRWEVTLQFVSGRAEHKLFLTAKGNRISGTHFGTTLNGPLKGTIDGDRVALRSGLVMSGGGVSYDFTGTVNGDTMSGEVGLGEYGKARWTARRKEDA